MNELLTVFFSFFSFFFTLQTWVSNHDYEIYMYIENTRRYLFFFLFHNDVPLYYYFFLISFFFLFVFIFFVVYTRYIQFFRRDLRYSPCLLFVVSLCSFSLSFSFALVSFLFSFLSFLFI